MQLRIISYDSPHYAQAKQLRHQVLRVPLGLALSEKDTQGEESQLHLAAIVSDQVIGTVILKLLSPTLVKLRQMAVAKEYQGQGVGRQLVTFAELVAREKGHQEIELHSRCYARGFYEALGYAAEGEEFIDVTLPHIAMRKRL